jgi:hypothetical protein
MIDFEKAALLLDVVHKAATAGPAFNWVGALATEELAMMKAPTPVVREPVEEEPAEETKDGGFRR